MSIKSFTAGMVLSAMLGAAMPFPAQAAIFTATGSDADGTLGATANITVNNGSISVILTNTVTGTHGHGIADLNFSVGVASIGAVSLVTGTLVNVDDNANVTPFVGSPPTFHWVSGGSGGDFSISTLSGGQPYELILGSSVASGHNGGWDNFNPYFQGATTFSIACTLCTAGMSVTDVSIGFGTSGFSVDATAGGGGGNPPAVPEPSTWAMMLLGFLGMGFMAYRRRVTALQFRTV